MPDTAVVLVGHGSRDAGANAEFEAVAAAYRALHPELDVHAAHIELARPLLSEALESAARNSRHVVVVPMLLFAAGHVKNDVPLALSDLRARFPRVRVDVAPALGVHPSLVSLAHERAAVVMPSDQAVRARTLLLVVGRGSSDPDANGDFCKVARLVAEGRGLFHVEPAFLGVTEPRVGAALALVARMRPDRLVVLPFLLFAGRLVARLAQDVEVFAARHPWIATSLAPHLGVDDKLFALVDERVRGALGGSVRLPCDNCQYRTPLAGLGKQVGGLRALLYSARHTLTHSQAAMPEHTHRPLKKHVLVCANADCMDRGSIGVLDALRARLKAMDRSRDIRVTRTSCMGRCGEGPTVAVYPDGVWYRGVRETDVPELVREHLLEDRLVGRLVGDILQ